VATAITLRPSSRRGLNVVARCLNNERRIAEDADRHFICFAVPDDLTTSSDCPWSGGRTASGQAPLSPEFASPMRRRLRLEADNERQPVVCCY
jgi:hypothetical protein